MFTSNNHVPDEVIIATMESLVPEDHLLRKIDRHVQFQFIYDIVKPYYSTVGRPSIDPIILFKIVLLKHLFGLGSMRKTIREIDVNAAYRWFLGIPFGHKVPDHSTYSQNYLRRFKDTNVFNQIFENILSQLVKNKLLDVTNIYIDSTHVRASANNKKYIKKTVEQSKSVFEEELLKDINEQREDDGMKPFESSKKKQKTIKTSTTDPDCGWYSKGEKERQFAYGAHIGVDEYGFVLGVKTAPGNIHDTQIFKELHDDINHKFGDQIEGVAVDSGYKTAPIIKHIMDNGEIPYMPYKRTNENRKYYRHFDFVYDEYYDDIICPNNELMIYRRTTRQGYLIYEGTAYKCQECPLKKNCFDSNKDDKRTLRLHIYHQYKEFVEHQRHTWIGKAIYQNRSMTVERRFGDMKVKHNGRFTYYRGIDKVRNDLLLLFTAMNIKKMALTLSRLENIRGKSLFSTGMAASI